MVGPRGSQGGSRAGSVSGGLASGRSRSGSNASTQAGGPPGSPSGTRSRSGSGSVPPSGKPNPFGPSLGYDPARDPTARIEPSVQELVGKRVDLPPEAFKAPGLEVATFTKRPGFNSEGKPVKLQLNVFAVKEWPNKDIFQYDINVTPNPHDSRALVKKVWNSRAVQNWLKGGGGRLLYDGHRLAWGPHPIPNDEHRITVDLDQENGRQPRPGKSGVFYFMIRTSKKIRLEYLRKYLAAEVQWDVHVLECMNFMDHLIRQWPSEHMTSIKRQFYSQDSPALRLDLYTAVRKGTYSAFKLSENAPGSIGRGLTLNVDIANTAFWTGHASVRDVARLMLSGNARSEAQYVPWPRMAASLRPVQQRNPRNGQMEWAQSEAFKKLRRLHRLKFTVSHRGKTNVDKVYSIKSILFHQKYVSKGADAETVTFPKKMPDGSTREVTVAQHIQEKWQGRLASPDLPLIETSRDGCFPMEICTLIDFQRYTYKLDPDQTAAMIKIAVSRPDKRKEEIMRCVNQLKWNQDPYLNAYGVKISPEMTITQARLLQNPMVHFKGSSLNPELKGRWDLRNKKFLEPNPKALVSWAFIGCGSSDGKGVQKDQLIAFAQQFARVYKGHGGIIQKDPYVTVYNANMNYADMCTTGYQECGNNARATPQIMFFVVATRNTLVYERIKKNMDCRICTVSQVLLADHVRKNNAQYHSNVAMKVNAKLGGATCRAAPLKDAMPYYSRPTLFLGLDVTHGSPGSGQPSMAALTMSMDKQATKWAANCQTNGWRVEIVSENNMRFLATKLFRTWCQKNQTDPQHIYFFRDGVSEGQFAHVIKFEVNALKRIFKDAGRPIPRFTVLVATKRHHIRFFPRPGDGVTADRNNNAHPGTLVERDATHPYHWDFYLSSHSAIQGTARPVHYHVIYDEANCQPNTLQRMIYHQCYQYARSTTPVSLHPAIYYAHLASLRARSHEDVAASNREIPSGKAGFPLAKNESTLRSDDRPTEAPPLVAMSNPSADQGNVAHINTTMWFI